MPISPKGPQVKASWPVCDGTFRRKTLVKRRQNLREHFKMMRPWLFPAWPSFFVTDYLSYLLRNSIGYGSEVPTVEWVLAYPLQPGPGLSPRAYTYSLPIYRKS